MAKWLLLVAFLPTACLRPRQAPEASQPSPQPSAPAETISLPPCETYQQCGRVSFDLRKQYDACNHRCDQLEKAWRLASARAEQVRLAEAQAEQEKLEADTEQRRQIAAQEEAKAQREGEEFRRNQEALAKQREAEKAKRAAALEAAKEAERQEKAALDAHDVAFAEEAKRHGFKQAITASQGGLRQTLLEAVSQPIPLETLRTFAIELSKDDGLFQVASLRPKNLFTNPDDFSVTLRGKKVEYEGTGLDAFDLKAVRIVGTESWRSTSGSSFQVFVIESAW